MSCEIAAKKFAPAPADGGQIGRDLLLRGGGVGVGARRAQTGVRTETGAGVSPFGCEPRRRLETIRAGGLTPCFYRRFMHTLGGSRLLQLPNRNTR